MWIVQSKIIYYDYLVEKLKKTQDFFNKLVMNKLLHIEFIS